MNIGQASEDELTRFDVIRRSDAFCRAHKIESVIIRWIKQLESDLGQICRIEIFVFSERYPFASRTRQEFIDNTLSQITAWTVGGNNCHGTKMTAMTADLTQCESLFAFGHGYDSLVATRRSKQIRRQTHDTKIPTLKCTFQFTVLARTEANSFSNLPAYHVGHFEHEASFFSNSAGNNENIRHLPLACSAARETETSLAELVSIRPVTKL